MGRIEKTAFISYRRTNFWIALAVFQNLNANGYDVFFDYKSIPSGDFEQVIIENVKSRAHFIVILTPSALERCHQPGDWLRREIETALDNQRNIIPLLVESFDFGNRETAKNLTGKLSNLKKYNALSIPAEYFDEAMERLRSDRFLNRSLESVLHPVSDLTRQATEEQRIAATNAIPIEKKQLTAQEWLERGYVFSKERNFDEAIRCFNEAIRLDPEHFPAYFLRGKVRYRMGNIDGAIEDYDEAIVHFANKVTSLFLVRADLADIYYMRSSALAAKGDNVSALLDSQQASELVPTSGHFRVLTIRLLKLLAREKEAKDEEGITRELLRKEDEYDRACFEAICGNTDKALKLLSTGLRKKQANREWVRKDPDFDNIRNDPRFRKLTGK